MLIMDPNNLFFGLALASRRFIMSLNFGSFFAFEHKQKLRNFLECGNEVKYCCCVVCYFTSRLNAFATFSNVGLKLIEH